MLQNEDFNFCYQCTFTEAAIVHHAQPWCARYAHVTLCIFVRATSYSDRDQVELGNFGFFLI